MAALPTPWFDTGQTVTHTFDADLRLQMIPGNKIQVDTDYGTVSVYWATDWGAMTNDCWLVVRAGGSSSTYKIATEPYAWPNSLNWSPWVVCQVVCGPIRVGSGIELPEATGGPTGRRYALKLFADDSTGISVTANGNTETCVYPAGARLRMGTTVADGVWLRVWTANTDLGAVRYEVANAQVGGVAIDTTNLSGLVFDGAGAGNIDVTALYNGGVPVGVTWSYPYKHDYNLAAVTFDNAAATVDAEDVRGNADTTPATGTATFRSASWEAQLPTTYEYEPLYEAGYAATAAWSALQDPALPSNSRRFALQLDPKGWNSLGTYGPIDVAFTASQVVFQTAPNWVGGAGVTVDNVAETFDVAGPGTGTVSRDLRTKWRNWVGLAAGGVLDPLFGYDRHNVTAFDYYLDSPGQDVWFWAAYARLLVTLLSPDVGTLTITVRGAYLEARNVYASPWDQWRYAPIEHPFTYTWEVDVIAGANAPVLDLQFPSEGGPIDLGRVDSIEIAGLPVGVTTWAGCSLSTVNDAYVTVSHDRTGGASLVWWSQDGAAPFANLTPQAGKDDETGDWGGALARLEQYTPLTWRHRELSAIALEFAKTQGFSATFTPSIYAVDDWGQPLSWVATSGSAEEADNMLPVVPHARVTPGNNWFPVCAVVVDTVRIPNGLPAGFLVTARLVLGGSLEAVCVDDAGVRVGAGESVVARRDDTGAVVDTVTTDAAGFAVVPYVPCDGVRRYRMGPP